MSAFGCLFLLVLSGLFIDYPHLYRRGLDKRLYLATLQRDVPAMERLIAEGANINQSDEDGNPLFVEITAAGDLEIARVLLSHKPQVNAVNPKGGRTALGYASLRGWISVVQDLIKQGADINATSRSGYTALMSAVGGRNLAIVSYLLKQGADRKIQNEYGQTALSIAKKACERAVLPKRKTECSEIVRILERSAF